jgi:hypothetical protein
MGAAVAGVIPGIVKALSCQDCARYVCNAMHCHSTCLGCCEFDIETTEVDIPDDNSAYSVEVGGCFGVHSK